ncbi:MAG: hypothetical protein ABSA49_15475 [Rhizomicrobium sp.]|jgi:hypothetical protein
MGDAAKARRRPSRAPKADAERKAIFLLACEMEEPLDSALAFAQALDLMGMGLRNIRDDHGLPLLAVAGTITEQLRAAKTAWRKIIVATGGRSARESTPQNAARRSGGESRRVS